MRPKNAAAREISGDRRSGIKILLGRFVIDRNVEIFVNASRQHVAPVNEQYDQGSNGNGKQTIATTRAITLNLNLDHLLHHKVPDDL